MRVFLLKSPWGKDGNKTLTAEQLRTLMQELDGILYDYSWDVLPQAAPAEGKVRFTILVRPVRGTPLLPRDARLDVALTLGRETRPPQSTTVTTSLGFEYLHQSDTWTILLAEVPWAEAATSYQVRGTLSLKLDPSGTRHVDAKVDKLAANFAGGRTAGQVERADGGV